jgi:hypothetical protein
MRWPKRQQHAIEKQQQEMEAERRKHEDEIVTLTKQLTQLEARLKGTAREVKR